MAPTESKIDRLKRLQKKAMPPPKEYVNIDQVSSKGQPQAKVAVAPVVESRVEPAVVVDTPVSVTAPVVVSPEVKGRPESAPLGWSSLDLYAAQIAALDATRAKQAHSDEQKKVKALLDQQLQDKRKKSTREKDEERIYVESINKELSMWQEYEVKIANEKKAKAEREQFLLTTGLNEKKQREEAERQAKLVEEKLLLERIEKEILEERNKINAKKMKEKVIQTKIMVENMKDREAKQLQLKRKQEEDVQALHDYDLALEELANKRMRDTEHRLNRQKSLMDKVMQKVETVQKAKKDEDNDRAVKQAQEKEDRAAYLDKMKAAKLEEMRLEMVRDLERQVKEKEHKLIEDRQVKCLHAKILLADSKQFETQMQIKEREKKEKLKLYQADLEKQIQERRARKIVGRDEMSESEKQINKDLLRVVDKVLHETIIAENNNN